MYINPFIWKTKNEGSHGIRNRDEAEVKISGFFKLVLVSQMKDAQRSYSESGNNFYEKYRFLIKFFLELSNNSQILRGLKRSETSIRRY